MKYRFTPRAKRTVKEIVEKTRRANREYAVELCAVLDQVDVGPVVKGTQDSHRLPNGTCKRGRSIGWLHTHPQNLPLATNNLSVGDATILLVAHADSVYKPGIACVAHPKHEDVRCYRVKHPIRREERNEMVLLNVSQGAHHLADLPHIRDRLEPIDIV